MSPAIDLLVSKINYWIYIALMMIGLYGVLAKRNLIKKIIGMGIMQTAIILFYVSVGVKRGAGIPILEHHGGHAVQTAGVVNPLPHVLMLTAIVVAVATLGVALALALKVHRHYGTLEEDEILAGVRGAKGPP